MRILLVDDDEQLMEVLANSLVRQHYAVDIADTGEMGWEFILLFNYDLVVLDWVLPDVDGVSLCRQIRSKGYTMPIMLLTARDRNTDKVMGLDAGADDYIVKPFDFDVLTARIRALLRREINISSPVLKWHNLTLDPKIHEVHYQRQLLPLTPKEYGLMELFMRHPQQVFSPGAIINNLWAGEDPPGEEAVRTHIKGLRQKLKLVGMAKDTIKTVYGVGYRLKADEDSQDTAVFDTSSSQHPERSANINQIWLRFRDLAFERLSDLERLAIASTDSTITVELQQCARNSAHKLAGSLGCFGFSQGSRIAKQLELLLQKPNNPADLEQIVKLTELLKKELQHQPSDKALTDALGQNISLLIFRGDYSSYFMEQLVNAAELRSIKTYVANDFTQARSILERESIQVLLHKIVFPDGEDLELLEQIHYSLPNLSIVAIGESAQLSDRLNFVRKGGNLLLEYPVEADTAISAVVESLENLVNSAKVLIIDDDPQVLLTLELSLQPWGFEVTTLEQPTQFWSVMQKIEPDVLVLDIDMPDLNGIELCQILRSDRHWQHLPVLFLSVHHDEKIQHRAFAVGADDYIVKPVTGSTLANRILNRIRRSRIN